MRFINTCGKPSLCISDADSSFKAVSRDYKLSDIEWINGFSKSKEFKELRNEFNIEFKFNTPNSPELQSLVERLNKVIVHSLLKLSESSLKLSQFRTLLSTNQAMLNKRSLGVLHENNPERWRIVTPHHLLTGYELEVSPNFLDNKIKAPNTIQTKEEIRRHSKHLQALMSRSWNIFLKEYVSKLNTYKKQVDPHRRLKIGDIVLYSGRGERIPIIQYVVCMITQIFGNQRSLKVETIQDNKKKISPDQRINSVC